MGAQIRDAYAMLRARARESVDFLNRWRSDAEVWARLLAQRDVLNMLRVMIRLDYVMDRARRSPTWSEAEEAALRAARSEALTELLEVARQFQAAAAILDEELEEDLRAEDLKEEATELQALIRLASRMRHGRILDRDLVEQATAAYERGESISLEQLRQRLRNRNPGASSSTV